MMIICGDYKGIQLLITCLKVKLLKRGIEMNPRSIVKTKLNQHDFRMQVHQ